MHSTTLFASILSLAAVARAQAGRFPCTATVAGLPVPNQAACATLTATGLNQGVLPTDDKADGFTPVNSVCVADTATTFACGFTGAACNPQNVGANTACDNGVCVVTNVALPTVGTCQGYFNTPCASTDSNCLGYLYCTDSNFATTPSNTCGGINSYCTQGNLAGLTDPVQQQNVYNALCASNYCNTGTGQCSLKFLAGQDCSSDPTFGCATGFTCITNADTTQTCQATVIPSGAARARRNLLARRSHLCPESLTACSLSSNGGYECVDTLTDLESCGGCLGSGGVDCTALPGVGAVGCVAGVCERW